MTYLHVIVMLSKEGQSIDEVVEETAALILVDTKGKLLFVECFVVTVRV